MSVLSSLCASNIPQLTKVNWSVWTLLMGIASQRRHVAQRNSSLHWALQLAVPLRDNWETTGMNCRVEEESRGTTNTYYVRMCRRTGVYLHTLSSILSWWTSQWSQCRGVCEQGKEVRAVFCLGRDLAIINDTYCSSPMPQLARQCSVTDKCLYSWKTAEWGNVSS